MSKGKRQSSPFPALTLFDESIGLLRERWLAFGAYYLLGAVPFYGYLIYFIEDASFGIGDVGRVAVQSLFLAVLYFWMKAWHCIACHELRSALKGESSAEGGMGGFLRVGLQQARLQGYALWGLIVSSVFVAPFGWIFAYSQFLCAVGVEADTAKDRRDRAWKAAKSLSQPVHVFLAVYTVFWIIVWLNVAALVYFFPELLRMFLGIENLMAQKGWNLFNTTFFVISVSATALIADAFAKAFFVKLLYKSESIRSGHDILSKFSRSASLKSLAVVALMWFAICPLPGQVPEEAESASQSVTDKEMREMRISVERALADSEISWRMKRVSEKSEEDSSFVGAAFEKMVEMAKYTGEKIGDFLEWLLGREDRRVSPPVKGGSGAGADGFLRLLAFLGIALVALFILWVVVAAVTRKPLEPKDAGPDSVGDVELEDESVHAALLPSDRWLNMAREKAEEGDYRLAIRAVFLATLALLGSKQLLVLAKHKSNLEYANELSSRGLAKEGRTVFNEFRKGFDRIWYGQYAAAESMYQSAMERFKRIDELSGI